MADVGFKFARRGKNVLTSQASDCAFSSAYIMDKILMLAIGQNTMHGLSYKPTILGYNTGGFKSLSYVDNNQVTETSTEKAIVLLQQGT